MKKRIVLFDIDFTIFDTATFRANLFAMLAKKLGYTDLPAFFALARATEEETKKTAGYVKIRVFTKILQQTTKTKVSLKELEDIFFDKALHTASLYPDTRKVLKDLVRSNIDIGIFSTGDKEFQLQKIATLKDLFPENHTHIFVDKREGLAEVFSQYKDTYLSLVDDFPAILYEAKKMDNTISTIWIKRDDPGSPQVLLEDFPQIADFTPDYTIKHLDEIFTCIKE